MKASGSNPLVSVSIAAYQAVNFIGEAIDSVLIQDYPNIEIVIGDDGSSDGTQEILKEYKQKHPDLIKLILSDGNTGITANSNRILRECTGKYIAFMAGDDLMLPGKIKIQVDYMEKHPECSICYHNLEVFESETGKILRYFNGIETIIPREGKVDVAVKYGTFNGAVSNMVRRSSCPVTGFDTQVPYASDWLFWVETLINGGEIHYINQVLGRYRRHKNNVTNDNSNQLLIAIYKDHLNSTNVILFKYPQFTKETIFRKMALYSYLRVKDKRIIHKFRWLFSEGICWALQKLYNYNSLNVCLNKAIPYFIGIK